MPKAVMIGPFLVKLIVCIVSAVVFYIHIY
jgi:hypothetical protein